MRKIVKYINIIPIHKYKQEKENGNMLDQYVIEELEGMRFE